MASLTDGYTMSNDAVFMNRVSEALARHAYFIITQEADNVADHDVRLELARRVADDVNNYAYRFSRMVAGNASIAAHAPNQGDVPDSDIEFAVNDVWKGFTIEPTPPFEPAE